TISIGAAIRKDPLQTLEELIEQADSALYKAKAKGRNRVEML
ncbi:MAG: diguanylate cyclase, partial [Oxalobacter sp.]|nr:diguanylate cyclase [Oxalobacter sp.]